MEITTEVIEGITYYLMVSRGVTYTFWKTDGEWALKSRRVSISNNVGTVRFFGTLTHMSESLKAFRGIDKLIM